MPTPNVAESRTIAEYTDTIGQFDYNLIGAIAGCFRFRDAYSDGEEVEYIVTDGPNVEEVVGILTYGTIDTLTRDTVQASSNGGSKVNWTGNTRPLLRAVITQLSRTGIAVRKIVQGSTTTLDSDDYLLEIISGSLADTTVNGPIGTPTTGDRFEIKDKTGLVGAFPIIFNPDGAQTVEGNSSYSFDDNFGAFSVTWDGDDWSII